MRITYIGLAAFIAAVHSSCSGVVEPQEPVLGARAGHAMAYDETFKTTVLFGGVGSENGSASTDQGSTWTYNGSRWSRVSTTGPSPRHNAVMVWDAARKRVVLFGGRSGSFPNEVVHNDTWEWDGGSWSRVALTGPSPRVHLNIAFDRGRNRTILYGGFSLAAMQELRDIWEWNGSAWSQASVSIPAGRATGAVFDEQSNRLLLLTADASGSVADTWNGSALTRQPWTIPDCVTMPIAFGGSGGGLLSTTYCQQASAMQTWRFASGAWTQLSGAQPTGPRVNFSMSYDRDRNRVVLFGGEGLTGGSFADTWEFDGTSWGKISGS